jgi:hypothetical protein
VGLGLVGVLAPLADRRWRRSCGPAAGACAFVALVLAMAYHWAPLQALAPVRALNPGRYLVFVSFFIALAAGVGGQILARRRTAFWGWALLALLVDLGPTTFLHGYVDAKTRDMISGTAALEGLRSEVAALPVGQVPAYRLFISTGAVHSQLAVGAVHVEGIPTFQSLHPGAVRASTAFGRPLEQLLNQVLEPLESPAALALHPLADVVSGGLGLFNTRYVLINQPDRYFFSAQGLAHTPVLASAAALPYTEKDDFFEDRENLSAFIRGLGVDVASSTCRQLELRGLAAPVALGTPPQVTVLEHRVWPQRVSLRLRLDSPAFVRLAYAWFPSLAVEVDGVSAPVWQTATRCIALRLPAGEHQIELVPRLSDWRLGLLVLDVFIVFAWVAVRFRCHKKRMA